MLSLSARRMGLGCSGRKFFRRRRVAAFLTTKGLAKANGSAKAVGSAKAKGIVFRWGPYQSIESSLNAPQMAGNDKVTFHDSVIYIYTW